jgi:hypothetical protein
MSLSNPHGRNAIIQAILSAFPSPVKLHIGAKSSVRYGLIPVAVALGLVAIYFLAHP